jgi:CheY-like chemotaxis protein
VNTVTVLLVDDDKADTMAVRRSFLSLNIANPVIEARNGIEALDRLRGLNGYEMVPRPCLVMLDLNMSRMGGIEFLGAMRADPLLRRILVFVMTTAAVADRMRAYNLNVADYMLKHRPGQSFFKAIGMLWHFLAGDRIPGMMVPDVFVRRGRGSVT